MPHEKKEKRIQHAGTTYSSDEQKITDSYNRALCHSVQITHPNKEQPHGQTVASIYRNTVEARRSTTFLFPLE